MLRFDSVRDPFERVGARAAGPAHDRRAFVQIEIVEIERPVGGPTVANTIRSRKFFKENQRVAASFRALFV